MPQAGEALAEPASLGAREAAPAGPRRVHVTHGEPAFVYVGREHINRIVTPFREFDVVTSSPEEIDVRGSVFYVSPVGEEPITMFITPVDDERLAISLTLVPQKRPPTEIALVLENAHGALVHPASLGAGADAAGGAAPGAASAPVAPAPALPSRESGPYEDRIAATLTAFATGEVPDGYVAGSLTATHPSCRRVGGLEAAFARGQRYVGAAFEVFVGLVENTGMRPAEFDETRCADPSVAAVAVWPAGSIAPGGSAEIFVMRRRASDVLARPARARPSLLAGDR
jgi:conjugal transfer pilus assembly protein TraK